MDKKALYLSTIDPRAGEIARKYGLGLEIAEFCTALNMDENFPEMDARVRGELGGIEKRMLHAPFNELFPCAVDPRARALAAERYRQAIALAAGYGAKRVVIHGGFQPFSYYRQWYVEQSVIFWKDFLREIPADTELLLENVLEPEPEYLLDIVSAVGDARLGLCLDVGHGNVYSKVPLDIWLETLAPYLRHFHIHNNDGAWDTHGPLDRGTIPIKHLLARARELCPGASSTLELPEAEPSVRWLLEE